jgi:hypothetical protein
MSDPLPTTDPHTFVTIATYSQPLEARVALTRLEDSGIEAFLADENLVTINWMWSNAVGGIKLQVDVEDANRASEALALNAADGASADVEDSDSEDACPQCGSAAVGQDRYHRRLVVTSWLVLPLPRPFLGSRRRCQACGLRWKPSP